MRSLTKTEWTDRDEDMTWCAEIHFDADHGRFHVVMSEGGMSRGRIEVPPQLTDWLGRSLLQHGGKR